MSVFLTRYHLAGLGIALGVVILLVWAATVFEPPMVPETRCVNLGRIACLGDRINPDADWDAWSAIGGGFAGVWVGLVYLVARSREGG